MPMSDGLVIMSRGGVNKELYCRMSSRLIAAVNLIRRMQCFVPPAFSFSMLLFCLHKLRQNSSMSIVPGIVVFVVVRKKMSSPLIFFFSVPV